MPDQKFINYRDLFDSLKKLPRTLALIWQIKKSYVIAILVLSFLQGITPVISLLISQQLINGVVMSNQTLSYILFIFAAYVMFNFLSAGISLLQELVQGRFQTYLRYRLNYLIMQQCSYLKLEDFENAETYDLIEKLTAEVAIQPNEIFRAVITSFTAVTTLVSAMFIIFLWHPMFGIILLVFPLIYIAFYLKVGQLQFAVAWDRAKEERQAWYFSHLLTHDFSFKELQVFGLRDYFLQKYWKLSQLFIDQNDLVLRKKVKYELVYEAIMHVLNAGILLVALIETVQATLLVGNLISYIRALSMIENSSQQILNSLYAIYHANLYMDKLFTFLGKNRMHQQITEVVVPQSIDTINVQNLSFRYRGASNKALSDISLIIKKGESLAIVGENGSGKTTLIKLLAGLYQPPRQTIFIEGTDLATLDVAAYQKKVSILFQDFVKYELTLRENIAFGDIESLHDTKKIETMLQHTEFPQFANHLEQQLGNWFNEGQQLSQGQWQRIALMRTLFRESQICILDEPSAALDPISEKKIMEYFVQYARDKIGIFITHKIASAKLAKKVLVMERGEIVGYGSHADLLETNQKYQELWRNEHYE